MDQNIMIQNQMTRITFLSSKLTMKAIKIAIQLAIEYKKNDHKGINELDKFVKNNANLDLVEITDMNVKIMNKICKQYNFKFATERIGVDENGKSKYAFYFNTSPQKASYIIQQYDIEVAKEMIRKKNYEKLFGKKEKEQDINENKETQKDKERTDNKEEFNQKQREDKNKNQKDVSGSKEDINDNFEDFDISDDLER